MVNNGKPNHIILAGDFNCPEIDWSIMTINPKAPEKEVQQKLIDISTQFNLTQVHDTPTRENNLSDIVLTTNATLVKSSTNIPGLSDHHIIITDTIIKPTYNQNKPQKCCLYSKANWNKIDNEIAKICVEIDKMEKDQIDINTIWETFKRKLKAAIDENIPSKIFKRNNNLPWMTKSLRRMVRRKVRLYRPCRKSKQWT
jgi:hypothetical protein